MPALIGWIAVFLLVPQIVAVFAVPGVAEGPADAGVRSALQLELIPDLGGALVAVSSCTASAGWRSSDTSASGPSAG